MEQLTKENILNILVYNQLILLTLELLNPNLSQTPDVVCRVVEQSMMPILAEGE